METDFTIFQVIVLNAYIKPNRQKNYRKEIKKWIMTLLKAAPLGLGPTAIFICAPLLSQGPITTNQIKQNTNNQVFFCFSWFMIQ
jgi:hypothetical protein